jgi:hypothetical protein
MVTANAAVERNPYTTIMIVSHPVGKARIDFVTSSNQSSEQSLALAAAQTTRHSEIMLTNTKPTTNVDTI